MCIIRQDSFRKEGKVVVKSRLVAALAVCVLAGGCISSRPPECFNWTVECAPGEKPKVASAVKYASARLLQVNVRSPYDSRQFAVLRPDGSLAFDPYNRFAAAPAAILRGAALDALSGTGLFGGVYDAASSARTEKTIELTVVRLALDCSLAGERCAAVELSLTLLDRREVVGCVSGSGRSPAADGDYSRAFSAAFLAAVKDCAAKL
jgi:ABC-type uncharacterized transport system auxiliary subunit